MDQHDFYRVFPIKEQSIRRVLPITAYAVIIASASASYRVGFAHMSSECRMFSLFNYAVEPAHYTLFYMFFNRYSPGVYFVGHKHTV